MAAAVATVGGAGDAPETGGGISGRVREHVSGEGKAGPALPVGIGRNGGELNPIAGQVTGMACVKVLKGVLQGCTGPKVTLTPEISRGEAPGHKAILGVGGNLGGAVEGRVHPLSRLDLRPTANYLKNFQGDIPDWLKGFVMRNLDNVVANTAIGVHLEALPLGASVAWTREGDLGIAYSLGLPYINLFVRAPVLGIPGAFVDIPLSPAPKVSVLFHPAGSLAGGVAAALLPVSVQFAPPLPELGWTNSGVVDSTGVSDDGTTSGGRFTAFDSGSDYK